MGTIENDDAPPIFVSIDDVAMNEGDNGTTEFVFTVSLLDENGDLTTSSSDITVNFETISGTATKGKNKDYGSDKGKLTIAAGETTQTITIIVNGDTTTEADETFFVKLTDAVDAVFADDEGLGTILDDDNNP